MPKVGVLLSGCGVFDGTEVHEAVLTLLALDQKGATAVCCAPSINQAGVIDHLTKTPTNERRSVLKESARIARGNITDVAKLSPNDIDALLIPGGFGAAKNLCNFAEAGADCEVNPHVEALVAAMLEAKKPVGAICIAPALLARIAGKHNIAATVTVGNDPSTADAIENTGCKHEKCTVTEAFIDNPNKIVSTPAYMLGKGPAEVFEGIRKLVDAILAMI